MWLWLRGFGGGILPPAFPWSLKQALVPLPSPLPCKERNQAGFALSLSSFIHVIQTLNTGISLGFQTALRDAPRRAGQQTECMSNTKGIFCSGAACKCLLAWQRL